MKVNKEDEPSINYIIHYTIKMLKVHYFNFWRWINKKLLITYPLIEECARCGHCGRNVHDFHVPDEVWMKVIGSHGGVWCYDCFCNIGDEKLGMAWRLQLIEKERIDEAIDVLVDECVCPLQTYGCEDRWNETDYVEQPVWCDGSVDEDNDEATCENQCIDAKPFKCWWWFLTDRKSPLHDVEETQTTQTRKVSNELL